MHKLDDVLYTGVATATGGRGGKAESDDGRLKTATFDSSQGYGLRGIVGETRAYAHASELSETSIKRAAETVKALKSGQRTTGTNNPIKTNRFKSKSAIISKCNSKYNWKFVCRLLVVVVVCF